MRALIGLQARDPLDGHEEYEEDELRQRATVDAAGGGDDQVAGLDAHANDALADTCAAGLNPLEIRRVGVRVDAGEREIEGDVDGAGKLTPARVGFGRARPATGAVMISGVLGWREEFWLEDQFDAFWKVLAQAFDVFRFERRCDQGAVGWHGHVSLSVCASRGQ